MKAQRSCKKGLSDSYVLQLLSILASPGRAKMGQIPKKMHSKNLDMIAANKVGENIGIDSEENALTVFWKTGSEQLPLTSKNKLARQLIKIIALQYNEKNSNQTH